MNPLSYKSGRAPISPSGPAHPLPTEDEEFIAQEHFELWHRFCENKTAVFGLVVLVIIILAALTANLFLDPNLVTLQDAYSRGLAPFQHSEAELERIAAGESVITHILGTDGYGRDIFVRIIFGARSSLTIAFATIAISCVAGLIFGVGAGYFGGVLDTVVMRIVDVFMCLPPLLFSLSIVSALGNGMGNLILAVSITMTPFFTRVVRATVLSVASMDYIEAARANGATHLHIILRHLIPNCMGPIIVEATISLSSMIMIAAGLSFIGMGVLPPSPEWGAMLNESREFMRDAPWMVLAPGLTIMITALSFNLVGDGLRDALDPRLKK